MSPPADLQKAPPAASLTLLHLLFEDPFSPLELRLQQLPVNKYCKAILSWSSGMPAIIVCKTCSGKSTHILSADVLQFRRNVDGDDIYTQWWSISGFQEWRWPGFDLSALQKELQMLILYVVEDCGSLSIGAISNDE